MRLPTKLMLAAAVCLAAGGASASEQVYPVPTSTIYAGDVVESSALKDRAYPAGFRFRVQMVENPRQLIGKVARRTLVAGEPIPLGAVEENRVVTRGVPTSIVFEEGSLSITGVGVPQQNGSAGQMVQIKNMDSGRTIVGRVMEDGSVRVGTK